MMMKLEHEGMLVYLTNVLDTNLVNENYNVFYLIFIQYLKISNLSVSLHFNKNFCKCLKSL